MPPLHHHLSPMHKHQSAKIVKDELCIDCFAEDLKETGKRGLYWRKKRRAVSQTFERLKSENRGWTSTHPLRVVPLLAFQFLLFMLHCGIKWISMLIRLTLYVNCLFPLWTQVAWYYLTSTSVIKNIRYGSNQRNLLDVYLPADIDASHSWFKGELHTNSTRNRPVVVYITGGAWSIGYKAWGSLVCKELAEKFGCVCFCPDYRNFPQGVVSDMVQDVDTAMAWVFTNAQRFGGDVNNITLVGQSAGGHLSLFSVLRQVIREERKGAGVPQEWNDVIWPASKLSNVVGVSGIYDILAVREHLHSRGLDRSLLAAIFGGRSKIRELCPTALAYSDLDANVAARMPACRFIHGSADMSAPPELSRKFSELLSDAGVSSEYIEIKQFSHTDLIIEDLIQPKTSHSGVLICYIASLIGAVGSHGKAKPIRVSRHRVKLARLINPF